MVNGEKLPTELIGTDKDNENTEIYSREECESLLKLRSDLDEFSYNLYMGILKIKGYSINVTEVGQLWRKALELSEDAKKLTEVLNGQIDAQVDATHGEANDLVAKYEEIIKQEEKARAEREKME